MTWQELLDRSVMLALVRHDRLRARLGVCDWWFDPQNGVARPFARRKLIGTRKWLEPESSIQVLGSENVEEGYFLWEWANPINAVKAEALVAAKRLQAFGEEHGIEELVTPTVATDDAFNAETIAMVAVALCDAPGFYTAPSGLRLAFLVGETFRTPEERALAPVPALLTSLYEMGVQIGSPFEVVSGYLDELKIEHSRPGENKLHALTADEFLNMELLSNGELKLLVGRPDQRPGDA